MLKSVRRSGARAAALLVAGTLALGGMVVATAVPAAAASAPVKLGAFTYHGRPEISSSADGRTMVAKYLRTDHLWARIARDGDWANGADLEISGLGRGVSMFGSETAAISADGRTVVFAWSYHNLGSPTVHARVATFDGSAWALGDQLDLTTPTSWPDMVMDVSVSADGSKAVVLFHTTSGSGGDIYAQAIHGGVLKARVTIQEAMGGNYATPPAITSSVDGMTLVAVWRNVATFGASKLYSSYSTDGGLNWSAPLEGPSANALGKAEFSFVSFPMELTSSTDGKSVMTIYSPEETVGPTTADPRYVYIRSSAYVPAAGGVPESWTESIVKRTDALGTKDLAATMSSDGTRRAVAWQKDNTTVQVITSGDSGTTWSATPVTLRSGGTDIGKIDLAASADGTTLNLYWTEARKLYSAKSSDGGATWTAPVLEQDPSALNATGAVSVATSSTGATVGVVWEAGNDVYVLADGFPYEVAVGDAITDLTWSTERALSSGVGATTASVAASADGRSVTAVWDESAGAWPDETHALYASRSTNGGGTWSGKIKISAEGDTASKDSLRIISSADGTTATVFYHSGTKLYSSRFLGSEWSQPVLIADYGSGLDEFDIAASANGLNLVAAWRYSDGGVLKVGAGTSVDGGVTWSTGLTTDSTDIGQTGAGIPSLAMAPLGTNNDIATVVWEAESAVSGPYQIFSASVEFVGTTAKWGTTAQVTSLEDGQEAFWPEVSWSPDAKKVVIAFTNYIANPWAKGIQSVTGEPRSNLAGDGTHLPVSWDSAPVTVKTFDQADTPGDFSVLAYTSSTFVLAWIVNVALDGDDSVKTVTSNDAGKNWSHSYAVLAGPEVDVNKGGLSLHLASDAVFAVWFDEGEVSRSYLDKPRLAYIADPVTAGAEWTRYAYKFTDYYDGFAQVAISSQSAMSMVWVNRDNTVEVTSVGASSDPIPTTLTITTDPVSPKVGEAVKVMVALNSGTATGTITVTQGSSSKTCELTAGECSIVMPAVTTAGTVTYTVSYAGDGTHAASSTTKSVTVAAADTAPTTPANPTTPSTPVAPEPSRASGSDRYATSAEVSKLAFPDGNVPVAYITTGVTFADSLAASAAASASDGPVLLAQGNSLAPAVQEELTRLDPDKIVVLGGTGSVSAGLMSSLGAFTDGSVTRTAGADRYATSLEASSVFTQKGGTVILTTGSTFADSMSAGSLFGSYPGPVLLTREGQGLPVGIEAELKRLAPSRVFIVGGTGSVSAELEADVTAAGYSVTRLAGDDRYETSASVAEWVRSHAGYSAEAIVASGTVFADGVSAGVLAGVRNAPVMLTNGLCWDAESSAVLNRIAPTKLTVIGGAGSISSAAELVTVCK